MPLILVDGELVEVTDAELNLPVYVPPVYRRIYWSTLLERMTDIEAETLEDGIQAAGPKARILFQTTSYLDLDHAYGQQLAAAITAAFPSRAAVLLEGEF